MAHGWAHEAQQNFLNPVNLAATHLPPGGSRNVPPPTWSPLRLRFQSHLMLLRPHLLQSRKMRINSADFSDCEAVVMTYPQGWLQAIHWSMANCCWIAPCWDDGS